MDSVVVTSRRGWKLGIGSFLILCLIAQPAFSLAQRVFERVSARAARGEHVQTEMSAVCGLDDDERLTLDVTGAPDSVGYVSCGNAGFECVVEDDGRCDERGDTSRGEGPITCGVIATTNAGAIATCTFRRD